MVGAILGMAVFAASAAVGNDGSEFALDAVVGLVVGGAIGTVGGLLTAVLSLLVKGIVDPVAVSEAKRPGAKSPRSDRVAGLFRRALLGTYQAAVRLKHLQVYLWEFRFRFERRRRRDRTGLAAEVLGRMLAHPPRPFGAITGPATRSISVLPWST